MPSSSGNREGCRPAACVLRTRGRAAAWERQAAADNQQQDPCRRCPLGVVFVPSRPAQPKAHAWVSWCARRRCRKRNTHTHSQPSRTPPPSSAMHAAFSRHTGWIPKIRAYSVHSTHQMGAPHYNHTVTCSFSPFFFLLLTPCTQYFRDASAFSVRHPPPQPTASTTTTEPFRYLPAFCWSD